jgi:diaminopimelate epimerase
MHLTKHHGLANDFLVVLDEANGRALDVDAPLVRRLCARRTGLGADGLIRGARPDAADGAGRADLRMHLFNADGGRAEMSGNGIRCLAHALALARADGAGTRYCIATDAGPRLVTIEQVAGDQVEASVTMGAVERGPDVPGPLAEHLTGRYLTLTIGNPHLVVEVDDPATIDLETEGAWLEQQFPGGVNVEFVAVDGRDMVSMSVWERGVGVTQACGTGACAAAHAAHGWGLVADTVDVVMPGGTAKVALGDDIVLTGPSTFVAEIEVTDG